MKKIINGRKYDTDTAEIIDSYSNECTNSSCFCETLYQKRTKEIFLYCYGGPMSKYCQSCDNGWTGGEKIIPLTLDDAKEWVENHSTVETYEELFGEIAE